MANIKGQLRLGVSSWCQTNAVADTTIAGAWLTANTFTDFPVYTVTGLLWSLRLPTNYFEVTPYRSLCGLGPFTNDVTVPYPHGYVTTETLAGGTNYPAGRTNWYTTDYGWSALPAITEALVVTKDTVKSLLSNTNLMTICDGHGPAGYTSTWAEAKSYVESVFGPTNTSAYTLLYQGSRSYMIATNKFYAYNTAQIWRFAPTLGAPSIPGKTGFGEFYGYGEYMTADTTSVFNAWGENVVLTNYTCISDDATNSFGDSLSRPFGSTNIHTWCAEPYLIFGEGFFLPTLGYKMEQTVRFIRRWNIPGGFTFY
jgi:hypothetical protein